MATAAERVVLDSSFVLEAILPTTEKWRREAVDLIDAVANRAIDARVPWIFFAELANVVTRKVRGRLIDPGDAADFLARIDSLGLHVDLTLEVSASLHATARLWNAGVYDTLYLVVAKNMAIPIATRDRGMTAAAKLAGVGVY